MGTTTRNAMRAARNGLLSTALILRRALMMINKAFHDADIKPAFPTVQVAGGDRSTDVAAAAQQALAKHNEAIAAASL